MRPVHDRPEPPGAGDAVGRSRGSYNSGPARRVAEGGAAVGGPLKERVAERVGVGVADAEVHPPSHRTDDPDVVRAVVPRLCDGAAGTGRHRRADCGRLRGDEPGGAGGDPQGLRARCEHSAAVRAVAGRHGPVRHRHLAAQRPVGDERAVRPAAGDDRTRPAGALVQRAAGHPDRGDLGDPSEHDGRLRGTQRGDRNARGAELLDRAAAHHLRR